MSNIMSPVKEVDQLWFSALHEHQGVLGRVYSIQGEVPALSVVIVVGEDGQLYGNNPLGESAAYTPGEWPWTTNVMTLLKQAGIISTEAMKKHLAACRRRDERRRAEADLKHIPKDLARYGIELTPEQLGKIEAVAERGLQPHGR